MKEYEYSFEVKSLQPYIIYCQNNKYTMKDRNEQVRVIYRNTNKTMARITINKNLNKTARRKCSGWFFSGEKTAYFGFSFHIFCFGGRNQICGFFIYRFRI